MATYEQSETWSVRRGGTGSATLAALAICVMLAPATSWGATPDGMRLGISERVVELFTSQGCPRCPPAVQLLTDLAREPDTIALSYAVNTWDFSGWRDTLASPSFTERQSAYAAARGDRRIFTPQAIVNGVAAEPGADRDAILREAAKPGRMRVSLDLTEGDGTLHIQLGAASPGAGDSPAGVYVLRVAHKMTVKIDRGPNSGQSETYTNVVRAIRRIGEWTGAPRHFDVLELKSDDEGYVVLVQAGPPEKPGAILAAGKTAGL